MIWTGYANYQKEIAQDGRQQTVKATVTLKNGYVYNFTSADIMEHGLSFSDGTSEAGKLSVGSFIGKCLTLKLYNYDGHLVETQFDAALIGMWVGLVVDASITEWVYLGTFGVGEHAESGGIIMLTAYDDSVKFDKKYDSTLPYPASLKGIVKDACAKCKVYWPDEDFANMNYTVNKRPNDDSITYADIVSYAAQLAGCYARINAYRQLIFGWYDMDRFYPESGNAVDGNDELTASGNLVNFDAYPNTAIRSLACTGHTLQDGTGNPSPDNVRAIHGVKSITISDGGGNSQVINLPQELFSLPDGTVDDLDVVSGKGTQNVGKVVVDGTENWTREDTNNTGRYRWKLPVPDAIHHQANAQQILCSHYLSMKTMTWSGIQSISLSANDEGAFYLYDAAHAQSTMADWKAYLAAQKSAGAPVTILYELAAPRAITGTPQTITASANTTVTVGNGGQVNVTYSGSGAIDGGNFVNYNIDTIFGGVFRQNLNAPAEIASLSSCTMPTEDIRVTGVKLVPTDSKKPTLIKGTDDYVVTIDKNPLAQDNIGYLLWNLAKQLIDFQFRPMEVSAWDNPSIEAGDVAYLTDTTGNRYKTIISNLNYEFGNYEKFSADAKSRADNDAERYSASEKAASALDMRKNSDYITTGQISDDAAVQSVNEWNQILIDKNDIDELVKPRVDIIAQNRIAPRGPNATIEGEKNSAPGKAAHTEGSSNISSGKNSHTEGEGSSAPGDSAHAENSSLASGLCSHAENMGIASGPYSSAKGMGIASGPFSEASGGVSSILTPYDETPYRNYFDGTHIPKKCYAPEASGEGARAHGIATLASGKLSEASGRGSTASGDYAYANGDNAHASASCAMSHGLDCTASGDDSYAGGRGSEAAATSAYAFGSGAKAKGYASCSFCGQTESDGNCSCSFGLGTVAHDANEFVIGRHNKVSAGDSANEWLATNNAFVIGNGPDIGYSNCFRVDFSGKVYGCAAFNTSGADYAEYFEWADGNPDKQDRVGRFVTLDGAKIKFAKPGDDVLGIVSACPSVVGDAASESWNGRYARDVFGRPIFETVNIPETQEKDKSGKVIRTVAAHTELRFKENPEYKPEKEMDYVPREKRPEWSTVGMVGKTVLIDDGSCKPGGYCEPAADGTGIATATQGQNNCRVMERLDDTHIKVCLK